MPHFDSNNMVYHFSDGTSKAAEVHEMEILAQELKEMEHRDKLRADMMRGVYGPVTIPVVISPCYGAVRFIPAVGLGRYFP